MDEFLNFRRFITPLAIQFIFWIGVLLTVIAALGMIFRGGFGILIGLVWLVLGPIMVRIYCELMILFFRIYDELVAIRTGRPPEQQGFDVMPAQPVVPPPPVP